MVSAVEFAAALSRYQAEKLGPLPRAVQREMASQLAVTIVRNCPVRTGLARGNMRLALGNTVARGTLRRLDPTGSAAIADMLAVASRAAAYSTMTFYNNVPYMGRLENGWSRQAPMGVFRVSVASVRSAMGDVLEAVRRQLGGSFVYR